jgi:hypothetical protein
MWVSLLLAIFLSSTVAYRDGAGDSACDMRAPAFMAVSAGSAMCTNRPTSTKWSMSLPSTSYSPNGRLTLRFSGSETFTGLLVVADKGQFESRFLPAFLRPGLCSPKASVTHNDGDAKNAAFNLTWTAPPVGSGPIRFVAMIYGGRVGRVCEYFGFDQVLSEGAATPSPPTPAPTPSPPGVSTTSKATPAPTPEPLTGRVAVIARRTASVRLLQRFPEAEWQTPTYDDAFWRPTRVPIGFGYSGPVVNLTDGYTVSNKSLADAFVRARFTLSAAQFSSIKSVVVSLAVDDAADVSVNGNSLATDAAMGLDYVPTAAKYFTQTVVARKAQLVEDENVIAVHVVNAESRTTMFFDIEVVFSFTDDAVVETTAGSTRVTDNSATTATPVVGSTPAGPGTGSPPTATTTTMVVVAEETTTISSSSGAGSFGAVALLAVLFAFSQA